MPFSEKLTSNLANRKWLVSQLRAEIVGPDPVCGDLAVPLSGEQKSFSWEEFRKPKRQINGEEIIWQDPPAKRYGAGILFPVGVLDEREQYRSGDIQQNAPDIEPGENQDVDEKLEKLGAYVLQNQKDRLEILRKVDELHGLLIDLRH